MFSGIKKTLGVLACILALPVIGLCQTIPLALTWMDAMGGPGASTVPTSIKVDAQNNMYVTGSFSGTVDFDPSANGVKNLTAMGTGFDGFIAKYNSSGGLVWASSFGGLGTDQPNGLDLDINGNLTLTGQFDSHPMDADPGAGVFNLTAVVKDAFIIRLDNNGNFLWAKNISGTGTEGGEKIVSDASGNLVAVGRFDSTINIDGAGIPAKGTDGYVVKYDAAGNVIWKFSLGALKNYNAVVSAVIDKNNNVTIASYINGTIDFNPLGPAFNVSGGNSLVIAQYSPAGILLWSNVILSAVPNFNKVTLAVDAQNNIFMAGVFSSSINFSSGAPLTPRGTQDVFLAKYNSNGVMQFNRGISGAGATVNNSDLVVGPDNNLYLSGYFSGTVDFDVSTAVANVTDHGTQDVFLARYDLNGNYKWAFGVGNSCTNDLARTVAVDANNNILLSGTFCSTVNFDPSDCTPETHTAQGGRDMFIAKYTTTALTNINNNVITPTANNNSCSTTGDPGIIIGSTPTGGTGAYSYSWQMSLDNSFFYGIPGVTSADYDPPEINKTTYFRRLVNVGNCTVPSISNVVTITITPPVANTISTPTVVQKFCGPADPALISGSALPGSGYNIQWQQSTDNITFTDVAGANAVNFDPPPISATTYYRRTLSPAGCAVIPPSNVITISIFIPTVISNNTIAQPAPDAAFCTSSADPAIINGTVPTGGIGSYTYQWQVSTDNVTFTDIANATAINYDPTVITATTYYRRTVSSSCAVPLNSNVITISVNPVVTNNSISIPTAASFCGPAFAGNIFGNSVEGLGNTYQWQESTDNITFKNIVGAVGVSHNTGLVKTTTYYRRLVITGLCTAPAPSNVVTITINSGAVAQVSAGSTICAGSSVTLSASGGTKYLWSPIAGLSANDIAAPTATPTVTTTYKVIVSNGSTCPDSAMVTITVIPKPAPDAGEDKIVLKGDKVRLAGKVTGDNVQYSWSPTTYLDDPTVLNPTVTPTESITYTLTATSANGCFIETDKVIIKVYEKVVVPNTFTPNGDGMNDTWNITAINAYTESVVTVYNREGLPVFKSLGYNKNWDGTFQGKLLPFGTYYYVIDLKNGTRPLSGWLAIVK